jgi:AraC-like DNA-binding protein
LADDVTVTRTALAVGYESTSAFVAAFRRTIGTTPGRYFNRESEAEL